MNKHLVTRITVEQGLVEEYLVYILILECTLRHLTTGQVQCGCFYIQRRESATLDLSVSDYSGNAKRFLHFCNDIMACR